MQKTKAVLKKPLLISIRHSGCDFELHYDQYGDKSRQTILFIHGAGLTHTFSHQYNLKDKFHIIVPHLSGCGFESHKDFNFDEALGDILHMIDGMDDEKIYLLGCSLGAELALAVICARPDRIKKAALLSPWVHHSKSFKKMILVIINVVFGFTKWKWAVYLSMKYWGLRKADRDDTIMSFKAMSRKNANAFITEWVEERHYENYKDLHTDMLVIYGDMEPRDIKKSADFLSSGNEDCVVERWRLSHHDLPMKRWRRLNKRLYEFFGAD